MLAPTGAQEGVERARHADQHAQPQQQAAPVVVLLVQLLADQLLALLGAEVGEGGKEGLNSGARQQVGAQNVAAAQHAAGQRQGA